MLADEATRKRFRKEALALAKLNHPNIETVYEFATQEGVDFLAMELIPGVSLDAKLAAGALPEQEVLRLGAQVAMRPELAHALAISGRHAEALKQLAELQELAKQRYVDPFGIAMVYVGLGDKDQALAWLDRAYDEHSYGLVSYFRDPRLDPLRSDPRFVQLGHRIGLAKPLTTPPTGQSLQRYIQQLS